MTELHFRRQSALSFEQGSHSQTSLMQKVIGHAHACMENGETPFSPQISLDLDCCIKYFIFAPWKDQCDQWIKLMREETCYMRIEKSIAKRKTKLKLQIGVNISRWQHLTLDLGCAAVPKLKFSIIVLWDKIVLYYLWPAPPPHTHTHKHTQRNLNTAFGKNTMGYLGQINLPSACNIT